MLSMIIVFIALTVCVAFAYGAWSEIGKDERKFVLKALGKGALFASIAFAILFVIVNLF